jgi:resuscitation-promoting factor RpfA
VPDSSGQWHLSDIQRLCVVVAIVAAMFLGAMAWGWGNLVLLLIAVLLLVAAGLSVFLLGLRYNGLRNTEGTAHVIMASPPPPGKIVARCDMRLLVDLPGGQTTMVKFRDQTVPLVKWPRIGMVLPIEVTPRSSRPLRIRWDRVEAHHSRPPAVVGEMAPPNEEFYADFGPGPLQTEFTGPVSPAPTYTAQYVPREPYVNSPPQRAITAARPYDPTVDEPTIPDPDPSPAYGVIARDAGEASAQAAQFEVPAARIVPQPRPAEDLPTRAIVPVEPPAGSSTATPTGPELLAMGIMLIVSDLGRSLHFYGGTLGFAVVDQTAGSAVLTNGGGRILLRQVADMSPVDRRVVHLHIPVTDVESSYQELRRKGVDFVHRPRVMSRLDRSEMWAATFRDPDGHAIALTQWRALEGRRP